MSQSSTEPLFCSLAIGARSNREAEIWRGRVSKFAIDLTLQWHGPEGYEIEMVVEMIAHLLIFPLTSGTRSNSET